jgi:hypothetical protein
LLTLAHSEAAAEPVPARNRLLTVAQPVAQTHRETLAHPQPFIENGAAVSRRPGRDEIQASLAAARDRLVEAWPRRYDRGQLMACQRLAELMDQVEELLNESAYRERLAAEWLSKASWALDDYEETGEFDDPRLTADRGRIPDPVADDDVDLDLDGRADVGTGGSAPLMDRVVAAMAGRGPMPTGDIVAAVSADGHGVVTNRYLARRLHNHVRGATTVRVRHAGYGMWEVA